MQITNRWRTAALVAGALLCGSVLGPPLAQAASAGLVRLEGGGSSHLAKVSASGRLSVNAALPMTSTGQLNVAGANPRSIVVRFFAPSCAPGGIYKIPAGKALIITAVNFYNVATSASKVNQLFLEAGPVAHPCTSPLAAGLTPADNATENEVFPSGLPVPAGDAIGMDEFNENGKAEIYGYLVPASAVPHNVLASLPVAARGGLGHS
jgi:hypothetical protein